MFTPPLSQVPEILFRPSDIGAPQATLAEAVMQSVSRCPAEVHPLLLGSVLVTGGTTRLPGFRERFLQELRPLVPEQYEVNVVHLEKPTLSAWQGGCALAIRGGHTDASVTPKTLAHLPERLKSFYASF
eukprot:scaffold1987_cov377-Prasinococcus_capsulatus_cf.AAC.5